MDPYDIVTFHSSCSYFFREGIKQFILSEDIILSHFFNRLYIVDLNKGSLRGLVSEVNSEKFAKRHDSFRTLILSEEFLMPLANYFVIKSQYNITAINKTALDDIKKFFSGNRIAISGITITEKEFSALALSLCGEKHDMNGVNPKTFYSQRYAALRKLGKEQYSMLYL